VTQFEIGPVWKTLVERDTVVSLKKGLNTIRIRINVKNAALWEPGRGERDFLYWATIDFNGQKLFNRFAFRDIQLDQTKNEKGAAFKFIVNGKPLFMKGCNIVPAGMFPASTPDSVYFNLVKMASEANMNMLRVWGGGYYLPDAFYDACDQYGILVWQDFMFACAMYPGDTDFMNSVREEISQQVKRLSSHPCIALFCGNNEISEGWNNWGWQSQFKYSSSDSSKIQNDYINLFEKLIPIFFFSTYK
jgi:beta-mannosidase